FERLIQLALRTDRFQDDGAPLLQFPQVTEPLLERAQLPVIERAGRLLAVARDERHGRTAVQQSDGRGYLPLAHAEFLGDLPVDGLCRCRDGCCHSPSAFSGTKFSESACIVPPPVASELVRSQINEPTRILGEQVRSGWPSPPRARASFPRP